jgi:hypothetical protein
VTRESRGGWATAAAAGSLVGALLFAAAPAWPDDWDGLGFLASVKRFDLDAFAPHPPGYPVYVALLKVASAVVPDAMDAAKVVLALSGAMTVTLLTMALGAVVKAPIGWRALLALAVLATPLGFRCSTGVGSEAPALAFTSLAVYGLAAGSPLAIGVGVGLGLGVRLSWAPLLLPLILLAPRRRTAVAGASASTLAWAVPLAAIVGPAHLARLSWTHVAGHATRWGGTAVTEPSRVRFLLRDLFVDGLGVDGDALGIAVLLLVVVSALLCLSAWRRAGWVGVRAVSLVVAPYLLWVAVGQNLREQPRHVVPLVALLALGFAVAAWVDRRARVACLLLFALVATRTGFDASARRGDPPAGAALVAYVRSLPDASRVLVFGGPSIRFFQPTELASRAWSVESMGDVEMTLTRVNGPPARILVTSEIADRGVSSAAVELASSVTTFCRPPRIDRKAPCIDVYSVDPARLR